MGPEMFVPADMGKGVIHLAQFGQVGVVPKSSMHPRIAKNVRFDANALLQENRGPGIEIEDVLALQCRRGKVALVGIQFGDRVFQGGTTIKKDIFIGTHAVMDGLYTDFEVQVPLAIRMVVEAGNVLVPGREADVLEIMGLVDHQSFDA